MELGSRGFPPRLPARHHSPLPIPHPAHPRQDSSRSALSLQLWLLPRGQDRGPPGPCPDHPAPGPGGAWRGRWAVLPGWPAAVWLRPRGCGLGTTGWLLREAAGISRTNRTNRSLPPPTPPCSSLGGELPLTSCTDTPDHLILQSRPLGKEQNGSPVDEEGCDWETPVTLGTASEPLRGGLTEPRPQAENRQIWVLAEWP